MSPSLERRKEGFGILAVREEEEGSVWRMDGLVTARNLTKIGNGGGDARFFWGGKSSN